MTVKGGDLIDLFAIGNVSVAGTVSAALGDGINWMVVGGDAATPTTIGALAYTGGANKDIVGLAGDVTVRHDVRIFTGVRGADSVGFYTLDVGGTAKVLGNVVVNTGTGNDGDTVDLVGDFWRDVSITTGGGQDTVCMSSSVSWVSTDGGDPVPTLDSAGLSAIGRDLTINTGSGRDLISIGTSTVSRNVWLDAGTENDSVRIDGMQVRRNLSINLGAGNDSLDIANLRAFAAFLYGGSGTNSLSTDTATRAASRTLRHYQFQAVTKG